MSLSVSSLTKYSMTNQQQQQQQQQQEEQVGWQCTIEYIWECTRGQHFECTSESTKRCTYVHLHSLQGSTIK
jgi:hypothetical protein